MTSIQANLYSINQKFSLYALSSLITRTLVLAMILFTCLNYIGCKSFSGAASHGWEGDEYENTYLSTSSPLGAKALKNWGNLDIDVREFLEEYRKPDVIYSTYSEVTFFYLKEKVQVKFIRPFAGKTKKESVDITPDLLKKLNDLFG